MHKKDERGVSRRWVTGLIVHTFVLKEIAHACPACEHQLRDIFDNLRLVLRREGSEPFRQALRAITSISNHIPGRQSVKEAERSTYHFTLPREQDDVSDARQSCSTSQSGVVEHT